MERPGPARPGNVALARGRSPPLPSRGRTFACKPFHVSGPSTVSMMFTPPGTRGRAQSWRRCGRGEPSPGEDVGGVSLVLAQMWEG
jgi:hypothetical protein